MTREELFENHKYVVKVTIISYFGSHIKAERIAKKHGLDLDDLYQLGYMGLWDAALNHNFEEKNFYSYGKTAVTYTIHKYLQRKGSLLKIPERLSNELRNTLIFDSMDKVNTNSYMEEYSMHDHIPSKVNVENYVIRKIEFEHKMSKLKPRERQVIFMKLNGLTDPEVAKILNINRNTVSTRRQRAIRKMVNA